MRRLLLIVSLVATASLAQLPFTLGTPEAMPPIVLSGGGGGGTTTNILDQFSGTVGASISGRTPDTVNNGNTWTTSAGTWVLESGGGVSGNGAGATAYNVALINAGASDVTIKASLTFGASSSAIGGAILLRGADLDNVWIIRATKTNPEFEIYNRTSGADGTAVVSDSSVTISTANVVELTVVASGTSINAYLTNITTGVGAALSTSSSVRQSSTLVGMQSRGSSYVARHDDFQVTTP